MKKERGLFKVYRTDKIITREKIRANPDVLYLFGDNSLREGLGGMAKVARDEPNCIGIVTKRYPTNKPDAFYSDSDFNEWNKLFRIDVIYVLSKLKSGNYKALVIPDGIGKGLANLPNKAPRIYKELTRVLNMVAYALKSFEEGELRPLK